MGDFLLQHQLHQFLSGRGHILETLSERHHGEAHAFKVLHHLHSAPTVEGDLPNIETLTQAFDELLDVAVVNDIAFRGLEVSAHGHAGLEGRDCPPESRSMEE